MSRKTASLLLITAAVLCGGCGGVTLGDPSDSKIEDGVYLNTFFELSLPIPEGWVIASAETEKRVRETGREMLSGQSETIDASLKAAEKSTFQLLMISEYPIGKPVEFNSNLILVAENVSHAPGIETGADYLFHLHQVLTQSAMPYERVNEPEPVQIGGREFYETTYKLKQPQFTIVQNYLVTIDNGFALALISSSNTDPSFERLRAISETLQFH